ncbi:amino acid adenylation domain-containing protein [Pendulispora rubella]|uniref:Amino acid adenylation domain-containing protein n=1 Tax=Pendulispora rubella TaxID=2741070 RepID=A0ABZ2LL26_9BACT
MRDWEPRIDKLTFDRDALAVHRRINRTGAPYPDGSSVKELFERCARNHADAVAVIHRDRALRYRELNQLANALAARLQQEGLKRGETVGVCIDRSPELIVALVAILKCGAAYLPFDPSWPDERVRGLFQVVGGSAAPHTQEAARSWMLSDRVPALAARFPECHHVPVLPVLPVPPSASADASDHHANPDTPVSAEDIAYINFTSGSTGKPKGVPIRHQSIARLVYGATYARLDARTVLLQLAPVTFDAATFEIWGALLHGGTCVLYPSRFVRLSELKHALRTHGVTVLFLTTALFNTVMDEAPDTIQSVETVLTGGEAHSLKHIRRGLDRFGTERLVSVYGPTECTTFATYYPIRELLPDETALPIGLPIQNTRVYVVQDRKLCAPGEVGEVLIAGPGLSPGYLGIPDVTNERFVEYDIDGEVERLYCTGDRAYLREDGNLVFQGRTDDQVKISGYRIELGEISHHLGQHPAVKQNFVTVSQDVAGEKALLAFVVSEGEGCSPTAIRDFLKERLPGYMIPSSVYLCESLPLSATGKVDRKALLGVHHPSGALSS